MAHRRPIPRPQQPICRHAVALAAIALLQAPPALAQTAAPPATGSLPEKVVSATRVETSEDEVAATVTSITAKDIERRQAGDVKDLLRGEAGVSVRALPNRSSAALYATGRGGNEGINIRGLEGNQVMLQVDGVRLPMVYASGPVEAGRGDYIDVEAFKRVELLRGPSSTSYGSDGLAGAVSFVTKDPSDLLTLGKPTQAGLKLGYSSADRSWTTVPTFALRSGDVEAMLLASLRRGHETETRGSLDVPNRDRTVPNPQDTRSDYLLGKLVYRIDARQKLKFSAEHLDRRIATEVYTLFGDPSYPTTTEVKARENIQRTLLKADYEYIDSANPWFQRANASVYWQDADNRQWGFERRTNTTGWNTRDRDTLYGERTLGGSVQFETLIDGAVPQRIVYGLDLSSAKVHSLKDGANLLDGSVVTTGANAFVRNKSFPDTDYQLFGAFVQDELTFGRLAVIPGLRLDRFVLDPETGDPLYTVNNSTPPSRLSGHELSPKLGLIWTQAPLLRFFAQYAHGFRAPTPWQVNGGVTNLTASQPYYSIGNPDLKPETSDSFEFGVRGREGAVRYSASVFRARYKNFIEANRQVGGSGTAGDPTVFQSVNLTDVRIRGFELAAGWNFLRNWSLGASYAHARGDSFSAGQSQPLRTIDPDKAVVTLRYEQPHAFGGELMLVGVRRHQRPYDTTRYVPGGFVTADLALWYEFSKQLSLNAALTNITNRKYVLWSDARDLAATTTGADAYSQPGRSIAVSLRYQF